MTALAILNELRRQGVQFVDDGGGLRVLIPKGTTLPDVVKEQIREHRREIFTRLQEGGITPEDVAEVFPGAMDMTGAVTWLKTRLATPRHIAELVAEWVGPVDRPTGRDLDTLMQVRWMLKVVAYVGKDGRFWWRLPEETVQ